MEFVTNLFKKGTSMVRCFKYRTKGRLRHAVWIMPDNVTGTYFAEHGNEMTAARISADDLLSGRRVNECTPDEVLAELAGWDAAIGVAFGLFDKHGASYTLPRAAAADLGVPFAKESPSEPDNWPAIEHAARNLHQARKDLKVAKEREIELRTQWEAAGQAVTVATEMVRRASDALHRAVGP